MVSAYNTTLQPYYSPSQSVMQALHIYALLPSYQHTKKQAEMKLSLFPSY